MNARGVYTPEQILENVDYFWTKYAAADLTTNTVNKADTVNKA